MAPDPVEVDTDPLPRVAASYVSKAQQIRQVSLNLANLNSEYLYAFGDDDSGEKVQRQFRSLMTGFQDSLALIVRVVDGTGDGINAMSKQYNRVEDHNTDLAKRMGEGSRTDSFDATSPNSDNNPSNSDGGGGNPTNGGGGNNTRRR